MELISQSRPFFRNAAILVLDSSFNPPHRAHYALVKLAALTIIQNQLSRFKTTSPSEPYKFNVLISYSATNADKGTASFEDQLIRGELMSRFAQYFFDNKSSMSKAEPAINWAVAIARSPSPRFTDKCKDITRWLKNNTGIIIENQDPDNQSSQHTTSEPFNLNFLMGFDTLVRFLDPKYYPKKDLKERVYDKNLDERMNDINNSDIINSLNEFFDAAHIYSLPRGEDDPSSVKNLWLTGYPSRWASCIHIITPPHNDLEEQALFGKTGDKPFKIPLSSVSSTKARNFAKEGDYESLLDLVQSPQIVEFIKTNNLYK